MLDTIKWGVKAVIEKFDAGDIAAYARRGRLQVSRGEFGLWAPRDAIVAAGIQPYETEVSVGNLLTQAGVGRIWNLFTNQGATQSASATATRVGVGNGTTAETDADTDLAAAAGSTNRYFNPVDAVGTVTQATKKLAMTSTFATANGNFVWNEWCVDIGTPTVSGGTTVNACMVNRKVVAGSLGTKTSAASWAFTVSLTLA